jgi:hypothetical protein
MTPLRTYQFLFGLSIITNVGIALVHVFAPAWFAGLVGLHWEPDMLPFARAWGATLFGLHLVYLPGFCDPLGRQWPNWSSIAIKFMMPIIFVSNPAGFLPFAAWDALFGVVLLIAYARLVLDDALDRFKLY